MSVDCTISKNLDQDLVQHVRVKAHEVCDRGGTCSLPSATITAAPA